MELLGLALGLVAVIRSDQGDYRDSVAKYKQAIERDKAQAASMHITGTPSFIIGRTTPVGVDGIVVIGAYPFASFDAKLKELESAK